TYWSTGRVGTPCSKKADADGHLRPPSVTVGLVLDCCDSLLSRGVGYAPCKEEGDRQKSVSQEKPEGCGCEERIGHVKASISQDALGGAQACSCRWSHRSPSRPLVPRRARHSQAPPRPATHRRNRPQATRRGRCRNWHG